MEYPIFEDNTKSDQIILGLINACNYKKARELINKIDIEEVYLVASALERDEYNFDRYKEYIYKRLEKTNINVSALFDLGEYYMQIGEFEKSQKIFEYLISNAYLKNHALERLVHLNMLKNDYLAAQSYFEMIRLSEATSEELKRHKTLELYLKYFLGRLRRYDIEILDSYNYLFKRLMNYSDEVILEHIQKHCGEENAKFGNYFYEDLDMSKLLIDSQEKIQKMNAIHTGFADKYRFELPNSVGISDYEDTKDVCVVTILGTKDIITMYPISLSQEFDKEGYSKSKEFELNRIKGAIQK